MQDELSQIVFLYITFLIGILIGSPLSPNNNCLCPLPTGNILSTILGPVIEESFILALDAILTPLFNRL